MAVMQIDGSTVGWESYGDPDGVPVLWCHGGLSSRLDASLAYDGARKAGARIISIDRPGIGRSAPAPVAAVDAWPPVAGAVMDQLGYERFAVAGWSAGAPYALACAHRFGTRVRGVATVAGMYPVVDPDRRRELGLLLDRVLLRIAPRHRRTAQAIVALAASPPDRVLRRALLRSATGPERSALAALRVDEAVGFLRESVRQGAAGVVDDYRMIGADWGFALGAVDLPVTVWHGADDPLVPLRHGSRLAAELEHAELRTCPGAGHFLPLTHAHEIFAGLAAGFT